MSGRRQGTLDPSHQIQDARRRHPADSAVHPQAELQERDGLVEVGFRVVGHGGAAKSSQGESIRIEHMIYHYFKV